MNQPHMQLVRHFLHASLRYSQLNLMSVRGIRGSRFTYELVEKKESEIEHEHRKDDIKSSHLELFAPEKELITSKPSSITVEVLGKEIWPEMTDWRKNNQLERARRFLPLPISLTGLGDGDMPRYWRHEMKKALRKIERMKELDQIPVYNQVTPSVRLLIENFPDKVSQLYPKFYESYFQSKSAILSSDKSKCNENMNLPSKPLQFPYELMQHIKKVKSETEKASSNQEDDVIDAPRFSSGLVDTDYNNYRKHHELLQFMALSLKGVKLDEYEGEIQGWRDDFWRRNYGYADASIPPSNVPCSGCGAFLHCTDQGIPGYMPSEKFKLLSDMQLKKEQCQRCEFLDHFNVAINVTVKQDEYPKLISQIYKTNAMVIIMIDLLDFPCSIWPGIINLIGKRRPIHIVGNKVDLLPKDDPKYLVNVKNCLRKSLHMAGVDNDVRIQDVSLISAKTGWGVESLITKLMKDRGRKDMFLIGCTNVGKSTLFNALLQSDLCKLRENDLICRATTSIWPGTTLNLLKFPINTPPEYLLEMRLKRIRKEERIYMSEKRLKWSLYRQTKNPQYATLAGRVGMTFRNDVPFTVQSGHPFATKRSEVPFNPDNKYFKDCGLFHDTPGTIYKDQILTLLTTEELLKTVPRELITPRTFTLRPLQTLFIGGLGRIDLVHARQQVWFTVFASHYLPIHIVYTQEARRFYEGYLGTDMLGVPIGSNSERIKHWPQLLPREFTMEGIGWSKSCADIVLSSAGWVGVTLGPDTECVLRAFTPEGRGIFLREPSLLPYASRLRGKRIVGTPCFENKLFTIDDMVGDDIPNKWIEADKYVNEYPRRYKMNNE